MGNVMFTASHDYKFDKVAIAGGFKIRRDLCSSNYNQRSHKAEIYYKICLQQHTHRVLVFRLTAEEFKELPRRCFGKV